MNGSFHLSRKKNLLPSEHEARVAAGEYITHSWTSAVDPVNHIPLTSVSYCCSSVNYFISYYTDGIGLRVGGPPPG